MSKIRRKEVLDSLQWLGEKNFNELFAFTDADNNYGIVGMLNGRGDVAQIRTSEGILDVTPSDWIIKNEEGKFSTCTDFVFKSIYENVGLSKLLIEPQDRMSILQVISANTQMCGKQMQKVMDDIQSDNKETDLQFAQSQLTDHQSIYSLVQAVITLSNTTSTETMNKTLDNHIDRLEEEVEKTQDLEFLKKLQYNIEAWKKTKALISVLKLEIPEDFMEVWKSIQKA